jgi:hypothetical protein
MSGLEIAGSIVSMVAGVATAAGVIFAAVQIGEARRSLEATTVYNLQKDARDLIAILKKEGEIFDYIYHHEENKEYPEDLRNKADFQIATCLQFYSSVFNQHRNGVITDKYWPAFESEICNFICRPAVAAFWNAKVLPGVYSADFKSFGNSCLSERKGAMAK